MRENGRPPALLPPLSADQAGKKKFYSPRPEQCKRLLDVVGDVAPEPYFEAIEADKLNFKRTQQWENWREIHRYPEWATLEDKNGVVQYHHHHCGRVTTDLAEVTAYEVIVQDIKGVRVSLLQEDWIDGEKSWRSIAIPKDDSVNQSMLSEYFPQTTEWQTTERFYFGIIQEQ